jgi:hypothetical protein
MKALVLMVGLVAAVALVGCNNEKGVPQNDSRVQTGRGAPGATPNQQFTVTDSVDAVNVPREGGQLDRGASRNNDPIRNAPNAGSPSQQGTGTGKETR